MGPREECSLHPTVAVNPDQLGSGNLKTRTVVRGLSPAAVAGKEVASSSVLRLQPDRVQCMVCHKCGLCCAARKHEGDRWQTLKEILRCKEGRRSGWIEEAGVDDMWRQYVLNHVVYNINAKPVEDHYECKFSDPIAGVDRVFLLWVRGVAIGFGIVRDRDKLGRSPRRRDDFRDALVLDAVFVSPGHRGRGYTAQLMERLLSEGKDLCLSYPVSTSMLIVAIKLTAKRGMLRERICMLLESSDDRKNVWWSAPKLARERGFDLRKVLHQAKSEALGNVNGTKTTEIRC